MGQRTSGWRSLLSLPSVYGFCQNLLGDRDSQHELVSGFIRPFAGMRILDLGCGPADILCFLPDDVRYVGIDLSRPYIEAAHRRHGARGEFHCAPLESMAAAGRGGFDLVMGLGVLHHLDDRQAKRFFELAAEMMTANGRCLTLDPCRAAGQHPLARLLIRMDRGANVRTAEAYGALAAASFAHRSQVIRGDLLRVPYTHHIMECR